MTTLPAKGHSRLIQAVGIACHRWCLAIVGVVCPLFLLQTAQAQAPVTPCDRLAAHPGDPVKLADGVDFADLDATGSVAACTEAIREYGAVPRFAYQLGRAYHKSGDLGQGVTLYRTAAEHGYGMAAHILGLLYGDGLIAGANEADSKQEAERWLRTAMDAGVAQARSTLGFRMSRGQGVRKNIHEAEDLLLPPAESGNVDAQIALALIYGQNDQFPDHHARAVHWLERAAEQDDAPAQHMLALYLMHGKGVAKDFDRAFELFEDSAASGYADARRFLSGVYGRIATMQTLGAPVPTYTDPPPDGFETFINGTFGRNSLQMMKYLHRMAEVGHIEALYGLAGQYEHGINVPKNIDRAIELYRQAAGRGHSLSQESLKRLEDGE